MVKFSIILDEAFDHILVLEKFLTCSLQKRTRFWPLHQIWDCFRWFHMKLQGAHCQFKFRNQELRCETTKEGSSRPFHFATIEPGDPLICLHRFHFIQMHFFYNHVERSYNVYEVHVKKFNHFVLLCFTGSSLRSADTCVILPSYKHPIIFYCQRLRYPRKVWKLH